jgi:hypothetical protein
MRLWLHARHPMLGRSRAMDLINSWRAEEFSGRHRQQRT